MIMRRRFMSQSDYLQPLYFEAVSDGLKIRLILFDVEYRIGIDGEWKTLVAGEYTPPVKSGTKVFFKKESKGGLGCFDTNLDFNLGGDCRSLLYGDKVLKDSPLRFECFAELFKYTKVKEVEDSFLPATTLFEGCYRNMFYQCINLVNAPKLPAMTLAVYCYNSMFEGCTSLETAPELPAIALANSCYSNMFSGCKSLINAPELPATTLAERCYYFMFKNCTKLNYIKMLATDIPTTNCLDYWVSGVSSTGTFVKSKDATWNTTPGALDYDGVPAGWTVITEGQEGKTVNNVVMTIEEGGMLRPLTVTMEYPASSLLKLEYTTDNGITWKEHGATIPIGYTTFSKTEYHLLYDSVQYRLNPSEDDVYIYQFTIVE